MKKLILTLGACALIFFTGCKEEETLSPEAEAMKLLITNDINNIDDLMLFKVYDALFEVVYSAWNSDQEDGISFVEVEIQDIAILATQRLYDEALEEWTEKPIEILYEDIDNYLIQNNKMIDATTGTTLRVGNNIVIYLK